MNQESRWRKKNNQILYRIIIIIEMVDSSVDPATTKKNSKVQTEHTTERILITETHTQHRVHCRVHLDPYGIYWEERRKEKTKRQINMKPEAATPYADPASGEGAGASVSTWAEETAAMARARRTKRAATGENLAIWNVEDEREEERVKRVSSFGRCCDGWVTMDGFNLWWWMNGGWRGYLFKVR